MNICEDCGEDCGEESTLYNDDLDIELCADYGYNVEDEYEYGYNVEDEYIDRLMRLGDR